MNIRFRLVASLLALAFTIVVGTAGYHVIEGWSVFDSLYMTVITLATVGYGETHELSLAGRVFTMGVIIGGIGILTYSLSTLTAFILEGDLGDTIRKKRMEKKIDSLSGHVILCGAGRTGSYVIQELERTRTPFVVIDRDHETVEEWVQRGVLAIHGDPGEDAVLLRAGIQKARGLISCLPADQDNLFVIITARGLNPSLRVISKSNEQGVREKFLKSGADGTVSPQFIGAMRMVSEMIRPEVVSFLDTMLRQTDGTLRVSEVTIGAGRQGQTLGECLPQGRFDVVLLAVRTPGVAEYQFNPSLKEQVRAGEVLIVMGRSDEVGRLQASLSPAGV